MSAPEMPSAALAVSGLSKTYQSPAGDNEVLKGLDLAIRPGQTVAIVGASGCGKSTLLNIVGSLDSPTAGTVRLGELEVTSLTGDRLADYRRHKVGFVFQDHHLLPQCTALENVALPTIAAGSGRAGMDRSGQLLERVGLGNRGHDFPQKLSGGERQRVAIARAILMKPRILVLDDATASVDPVTEYKIRQGLKALMRGRTTLIIAHRLATIRSADRVVVLRDGRIEDLGRHEELFGRNEFYRTLCESQSEEPDAGDSQSPDAAGGDT